MLKRDRSALLIGGVLLFSTGQAIAQPLRPIPIWSAKEMQQACDQALESAKLAAQEIRNTKIKNDLVATLLAFDQLGAVAQDAASVASLMMNTSPDASLRSQASDCTKRWNAYATELYQDRSLFDTLNLQGGDSIDRKLQADLKRRFESSGVQLDQEAQMRLRAIRKEMTELSLEFEKVLRDNTTTLAFTAEEARGVPLQVLEKAKKDAQGRYLLGFSYPEYQPFMDNAHDDAAKKRYYIAFTNRGGDRNIEILARLVELRESLAQLLGHRSYP
ncbi:MAG: Zn-dependent oligopeptidase, partial [Betaproteobacteria bacterium]|nr:Zn-dependent oligopeptidase [Betaproteobacteria bacterium]